MEDEIDRFLLRVADPDRLGDGARVLGQVLDQRHAGVDDYQRVVPQQLCRQNERIFSIVTGSIVGVSLQVGGIGIMNIMFATCSPRCWSGAARSACFARSARGGMTSWCASCARRWRSRRYGMRTALDSGRPGTLR